MSENGDSHTGTAIRLSVIHQLATGASINDAATSSGISPEVVLSWLHADPAFQDALRNAKSRHIQSQKTELEQKRRGRFVHAAVRIWTLGLPGVILFIWLIRESDVACLFVWWAALAAIATITTAATLSQTGWSLLQSLAVLLLGTGVLLSAPMVLFVFFFRDEAVSTLDGFSSLTSLFAIAIFAVAFVTVAVRPGSRIALRLLWSSVACLFVSFSLLGIALASY